MDSSAGQCQGQIVVIYKSRKALGMHEVELALFEGGKARRVPVSGGGIVGQRHVGAPQGQGASSRAQGKKLAGVARSCSQGPYQQQNEPGNKDGVSEHKTCKNTGVGE